MAVDSKNGIGNIPNSKVPESSSDKPSLLYANAVLDNTEIVLPPEDDRDGFFIMLSGVIYGSSLKAAMVSSSAGADLHKGTLLYGTKDTMIKPLSEDSTFNIPLTSSNDMHKISFEGGQTLTIAKFTPLIDNSFVTIKSEGLSLSEKVDSFYPPDSRLPPQQIQEGDIGEIKVLSSEPRSNIIGYVTSVVGRTAPSENTEIDISIIPSGNLSVKEGGVTGGGVIVEETGAHVALIFQVVDVNGHLVQPPPGVRFDSSNGSFIFDASDPSYRPLPQGVTEDVIFYFQATTVDGSVKSNIAEVDVVVTGVNDPANIFVDPSKGDNGKGAITEDTTLIASGRLSITDPDTGENHFQGITNEAGVYGKFSIDADGQWTYTLNNGASNVQALKEGETHTETFAVTSQDGTATHDIVITVKGTGDCATITGSDTGLVKEDGIVSATGILVVHDGDAEEAHIVPITNEAGTYGNFSIDADGHWTYTLNNGASNVQALKEGETHTETFAVTSQDGTATHNVVITVKGTNECATITGSGKGTVTEDASVSATGVIVIQDVDMGEAHVIPITNEAGVYGKFSIDADGQWTYTLNNGASNVQALKEEETHTETFTVTSQDETASHDIVVTVKGTNDGATITGSDSGLVKEDAIVSATGILTVQDVDTGEAHVIPITNEAGVYGKFSIDADGQWTYTLNNGASNVQALKEGETHTETFTVTSQDGTATHDIVVTVRGTGDCVTITNISGLTLNEANLPFGTAPNTPALSQSQNFSVSGPDGLVSVTIDGVSIYNGISFSPIDVNTPYGVVHVTGYSGDALGGTFTYTYELVRNPLINDTQAPGDLAVVVTSNNSTVVNASLPVSIIDDAPILHITNGNAQNSSDVTVSGTLADMGADEADAHIVFNSMPSGLTSGGVVLTYEFSFDKSVVTAKAGDNTVFTLTGQSDGHYVYNQKALLDLPTKILETNFNDAGKKAEHIYIYSDGMLSPDKNLGDWYIDITGSGSGSGEVNPSEQGLGIGNNLFEDGERITFNFDNEGNGGNPNLINAVKIGVDGFGTDETLTYIIKYTDGSVSESIPIKLVSGAFSVVADTGKYFDYIELTAGTDTSVRISSFEASIQTDAPTKILNFGFTAVDGDGDSVDGTLMITVANQEVPTTLMQEPLLQSTSFFSVDTQTTTTGTTTTQEIQTLDVQPLTIDNQIGDYNPTDLISIQGLPPGTKIYTFDTQEGAQGGYHEIGVVDGHSSLNLLGSQIKGAYFEPSEHIGVVPFSVTIHDCVEGGNNNLNDQGHTYSFSLNLINGHLDLVNDGADGHQSDPSHLVTSPLSLIVNHDIINEHSNGGHNQTGSHDVNHSQGHAGEGTADQHDNGHSGNHKESSHVALHNDQPPVPEHRPIDQIHHDHSMSHS